MIKNILTILFIAILAVLSASLSYASETEVIMNMLLKKGMITNADYNEVMAELGKNDILEKRVEAVEKHVDKHITHAEGPALFNGISIAAGITMVGQGTSGNDDNAAGEDVIDGTISADIEISAKLGEKGEAFIAMEAGDGAGLDGSPEEISNDDSGWTVNADATGGSSTVTVNEAWYEHLFLNDMLAFTIGKLDLTNYFDGNEVANDETTQFLSGGFVNSVAIEMPGNSSGLRLTLSPHEMIEVSLGAQSGDSDWEDIVEKPFLIAETDIKPAFGELQGNYRVYLWTNRTHHTEIADAAKTKQRGWGLGVSIDQQVTDFLTLFGRAGYQDKKVYKFDAAWSGGLALNGNLWGRENDVLAVAFGQARLSGDQEDTLEVSGTSTSHEEHLEAYYSYTVNEHVTLTPDVQVVTDSDGNDDFDTVVIGGVRGQFTF